MSHQIDIDELKAFNIWREGFLKANKGKPLKPMLELVKQWRVECNDIAKMKKRIAELEEALEIADYAFDLCHRYNGNTKSSYFNEAKQALNKREV